MAKKKVKKSVKKKTSKKVSKKPVKRSVKSSTKTKIVKPATYFINLLFLVLFLYAIFLLWTEPYTQGLSLIAGLLLIIFLIRLVRKLKK